MLRGQKRWRDNLAIPSPEREAMLARIMRPPKESGIPRLRNYHAKGTNGQWTNKHIRFSSLPPELRPEAERLLAKYIERHRDGLAGPNGQQKHASLVAIAARMAKWNHDHLGVPYNIHVMAKYEFKRRMMIRLGLLPRKPSALEVLQRRRDDHEITEDEYQAAVAAEDERRRQDRLKRAARRAERAAIRDDKYKLTRGDNEPTT